MPSPCAAHPDVTATHECTACGAFHCDACLRTLTTPGRPDPMRMCPSCGSLARALPAPLPTPKEDLRQTLLRPFDEEGIILIAALAVPFWLSAVPLTKLSLMFQFLYYGALSAYYFQAIEHIGRGAPGLPFSAAPSTRGELFLALLRGFVGFGVGFGPALASVFILGDNWPLMLLLLLFGVFVTPAVVLSIVITGDTRNGLWPLAWWQVATHDLRSYGELVGRFFLSSVAGILLVLLVMFTLGYIPFFGGYCVGVALTIAALVQASLVGTWVRKNVWTDEALSPEP